MVILTPAALECCWTTMSLPARCIARDRIAQVIHTIEE
jgi:hypothetical protein